MAWHLDLRTLRITSCHGWALPEFLDPCIQDCRTPASLIQHWWRRRRTRLHRARRLPSSSEVETGQCDSDHSVETFVFAILITREFLHPPQGLNTPTFVQHPQLPVLITPLIACRLQGVLNVAFAVFLGSLTRQTFEEVRPSQYEPCPELDTPSYQILENTLLITKCERAMRNDRCRL